MLWIIQNLKQVLILYIELRKEERRKNGQVKTREIGKKDKSSGIFFYGL